MPDKYYFKLYYGSTLLRDSSDFDEFFETEEDAFSEGELERDARIEQWTLDDAWHEYDSIDNFDIVVNEA